MHRRISIKVEISRLCAFRIKNARTILAYRRVGDKADSSSVLKRKGMQGKDLLYYK